MSETLAPRVGIVGATGMVGEEFLRLLEERKFQVSELRLFASQRSQGLTKRFRGRDLPVDSLGPDSFKSLDLVFFSSGDDISKEWAPRARDAGAVVVDNSAAFRMDPESPLVVPEVNSHLLPSERRGLIIANPNCSTIQLVVALKPLQDRFGLESVQVASYQAVSGAGKAAQDELIEQTARYLQGERTFGSSQFAHPMVFNCVPQIGGFGEDGFTSEERKIRLETRKILGLPNLRVTAMTVRVPVLNAHSEAVWVRLKKSVPREDVLSALESASNLVLTRDLSTSNYPMATMASGKDPVYVGRVHQDPDDPCSWMMWIVADNLRKGAALNGLQIAERIFASH